MNILPKFAVALAALLLFPVSGFAENAKDVGNYVIHYNAFNADFLPPKVAKEYGITRSSSQGMVNITLLKKNDAGTEPSQGRVRVTATNLTGQSRPLSMREVREPNAIYYIAQFRVANEETMRFNVEVQPFGKKETYKVNFMQKFYTN